MPRPCTCDKPGCIPCELYRTSPRHREMWDSDGTQKLRYPHMGEMVINFASAIGEGVGQVLTGTNPVSDKEVHEKRLTICESCPSGSYDKEQSRCRECGCAMAVKTYLKASKCPLGHW